MIFTGELVRDELRGVLNVFKSAQKHQEFTRSWCFHCLVLFVHSCGLRNPCRFTYSVQNMHALCAIGDLFCWRDLFRSRLFPAQQELRILHRHLLCSVYTVMKNIIFYGSSRARLSWNLLKDQTVIGAFEISWSNKARVAAFN